MQTDKQEKITPNLQIIDYLSSRSPKSEEERVKEGEGLLMGKNHEGVSSRFLKILKTIEGFGTVEPHDCVKYF